MDLRKKMISWLLRGILMLAACGLFLYFMPAPKGVPILEYHMTNTTSDMVYNVPPAELEEQLSYLEQQGYTTISVLDFLRAKKGKQELPEKPIILTFDDGYADNYTVLLPMLEKHGIKATVFMVTNNIGLEGYLTWDQLRDMQNRGIEIGSHTANHLPLGNMEAAEANDELKLSKLIMEWNGLRTIFTLSYPNGSYNEALPAMLRDNEYLAAVTGDAGLNTFQTDPYLLQRTNIPKPRFGLPEFRLRLLKTELFTRLGIGQHLEKE